MVSHSAEPEQGEPRQVAPVVTCVTGCWGHPGCRAEVAGLVLRID